MNLPYFFYRILSLGKGQITRILPRCFWDRVSIRENFEPMVELVESGTLILRPSKIIDGIDTSFRVRASVAEKLVKVSQSLPVGLKLVVIEGFRSLEKQKFLWEQKWNVAKQENPQWSNEEIDEEVRLVVARPVGITNHVCGGAVDVCLCDDYGKVLDFGTDYAPADEMGRHKSPMFSSGLTILQKENRTLLRKAMQHAWFVWYPGEWWHYCYNDRMWAVYTGRKECSYGLATPHHE